MCWAASPPTPAIEARMNAASAPERRRVIAAATRRAAALAPSFRNTDPGSRCLPRRGSEAVGAPRPGPGGDDSREDAPPGERACAGTGLLEDRVPPGEAARTTRDRFRGTAPGES